MAAAHRRAHRIVYAASADAARIAYATLEWWGKRCPGVVTGLREGGELGPLDA